MKSKKTLFLLLGLLAIIPIGAGCVLTSTAVEVRSIEEFPGGQIPDRRALAKALNTGANGQALAEANGNAASSATNAGKGGLAHAEADGYSKNNPDDPGDPRDGGKNDQPDPDSKATALAGNTDDEKKDVTTVYGDWNESGRAR